MQQSRNTKQQNWSNKKPKNKQTCYYMKNDEVTMKTWQMLWTNRETKNCGESDWWQGTDEDKWAQVKGVELMTR